VIPHTLQSPFSVMGAKVTLIDSKGNKQFREVKDSKGMGNQHSMAVEFGLGDHPAAVRIEVGFAGPRLQVVKRQKVKPNQVIRISP